MIQALSDLEQYILLLAPSATAVLTAVLSAFISTIKNTKHAKKDLIETQKIKKEQSHILSNMSTLLAENYELKSKFAEKLIFLEGSINNIVSNTKSNDDLKNALEKQKQEISNLTKQLSTLTRQQTTIIKDIRNEKHSN